MGNIKKKKMIFLIMLFIAIFMIILAIISPLLISHDPLVTDFENVLQKPCSEYPFGTDQVGRCIYSRVIYGARVSLGTTFLLLSIVFISGLIIGTIAGMSGGIIDTIIMRIADAVLSFPDIVFAIAIVGILGPGMKNTLLALSVIWWTKYARLTRVLVMAVKDKEYIHAATMIGASNIKIITHYIFPNIISPLIVQLALDIGGMMLALAGLSFLGLGVQPPTPEWGNMLNEGRSYIQTAPWLLIYPGAAIFIVVAVFNTLGDSVRNLLDPKHI
ncbi:ABC transporter permease subunit [Clostridium sp. D2Q-14]|uniref:nickel transporter permease n=1 Tax=Anaeromonas gelatinilytica TaxID=2683194 RepID=UPI00193B3268|nr:nickel transporter permease [Anaeromonas gelatinilytica]MBS4536520.1 ABC transporter permease subunit [Anaeromonas gelatinilytica]